MAGEVGRRLGRLVFVDECAPQLGVGFAGAGEVSVHDGEFGGAVGGQWPLFVRGREGAGLRGHLGRVVGAVGKLAGQGGYLGAVLGGAAGDDPVGQAAPQRSGGVTTRQASVSRAVCSAPTRRGRV